jgi:hypothetical protein
MTRRETLALAAAAPLAARGKWKTLFGGQSLKGWTPVGAGEWKVEAGAIVCDGGESSWLRYDGATYANFVLDVDFRTAADGNSGIFIRSAKEGRPWESGYEVQIFDQHPKYPTGSFVNDILAQGGKIRPGVWQRMRIQAVGERFQVWIDGKQVLDGTAKKSASGYVALQYNKGKKIEFRRVRIQSL